MLRGTTPRPESRGTPACRGRRQNRRNGMDTSTLIESTKVTLLAVAWKVAGALVLWLVGRLLIGTGVDLLRRTLAAQKFDPTLSATCRPA
jgi:hypothetical protein